MQELTFEQLLDYEEFNLIKHLELPIDKRLVKSFARDDRTFYIQFATYTVQCKLDESYPNRAPSLYWIGPPPDHKFYIESKRSNIANTRFGIYYPWYNGQKSLLNIIGRIKWSLTPEGTKEMEEDMY